MPLVEILTSVRRDKDEKRRMMITVRGALQRAFRVEPEAVTVWLREYPPENVLAGTNTDRQTQFIVHCFAGRTEEQKKALCVALCREMGAFEADAADFQLTLEESPLENWGLSDGASAKDLFKDRK